MLILDVPVVDMKKNNEEKDCLDALDKPFVKNADFFTFLNVCNTIHFEDDVDSKEVF